MKFAANFIAIDFETASRRADSACQLAAVVVREGEIAKSKDWLIRPEPFYFSRANIEIHGISPGMVENEPCFGELWPEISQWLELDWPPQTNCLVAHNASFDMGVLMACLHSHRIPIPEMQFTCTRSIARQTWPERPRFGLKPLSDWLGVRFQHHDALEDSLACAKILIAAGIQQEVSTLEELESSLKLSRGIAGSWGKRGPSRSHFRKPTARRSSTGKSLIGKGASRDRPVTDSCLDSPRIRVFDLQRLLVRASFIRPLQGRRIVFTGDLHSLTREEAESLAVRLGGICESTVTSKTNLLIAGVPSKRTISAGRTMSVKEEAARLLQSEGLAIEILSEQDFLGFVIVETEA